MGATEATETDPLPELSDAARALAARCEPRVNELARRMSQGAFERLRGYDRLPSDVKDVEIAATARHGLRLFLDRVGGGEGAHPAGDYDYFRERAAQRAEEGMPLHLLLGTHTLGAHVLWRALRDAARPGEEGALAELSDYLFGAQQRIVTAVTETYLDEQTAIAAERREERRSLARALLAGAGGGGVEGPVLVLCLRFPPGSVPAPSPTPAPVAARRLVRRLQAALDRAFGAEVLTLVDGGGGHALVPGHTDAPDELPALLRELREICGPGLRLAAARAERPADIAEAARTTTEIVRVARACGRPPGLHRLDDVLLEFHLSRTGAGSERIAALLEPVAERPELTETLRTYLEAGQDRRATARRLSLHPNTVDNRLTRVAALTGIDLTTPHGTALALAALLLRMRTE
ncbi:PucR family transcriptional regulator [Streptomyces sp. NPDC059009]|uniref:PucR family transcriptional regulator n=1 Tax=Streptomyces sp. NPDC059009 TaxID=3346694 RepID=UPI0036A12646